MRRTRRILFGIAVAAMLAGGSGAAAAEFLTSFQSALYAGRTADAAAEAERRIAESPTDSQARFALGTARFLRAIEHLGQGFYRYGLRNEYNDPTGIAGVPLLRLPVPPNPKPERATYEGIRAVLQTFIEDLASAEQALAAIGEGPIDLPLNLGLIRLDLDGDGASAENEALWVVFREVSNLPLDQANAGLLLADFDQSDVLWLQAYCHLLMAIAEFPLAHDWRAAFDATFHAVFPGAGVLSAELTAQEEALWAEYNAQVGPMPTQLPNEDPAAFDARMRAWEEKFEGSEWAAMQDRIAERGMYAHFADPIAFVHLIQWPVVEPVRLPRVLSHLEAMVRLSRASWTRILAETDQRKEWVPAPTQAGVLPGMTITKEQLAAWQVFLDEFQALLEGRRLLPHWRFEKGMNVRRLFLEPRTFDLVLLIQGSAALPYLESGPETTEETWQAIMDVFGGEFFRYALWLN